MHQRLGRTRGCYDLDCPGFVQTCSDFIIGSPIKPVSEYGTNQFYITITIYKDIQSGNWWVKLQDKDLGYWPSSIITSSGATLTTLTWGGEILNSNLGGHHTATKMGSGRFPGDKFGKSSFFRNLALIDESNALRNPPILHPLSLVLPAMIYKSKKIPSLSSEPISFMVVLVVQINVHEYDGIN
ncbi:hypothetical protein CK203_111353 [Vitis vinifera]|uniref:Neprosin PEP catalytic domain-containing protein n=1 Tax=Vitis vinifera TaxID=29760 RepID=A0A438DH06_VITVI|nr:hypothetical protein CK203_111353 [Vitis vinifera]